MFLNSDKKYFFELTKYNFSGISCSWSFSKGFLIRCNHLKSGFRGHGPKYIFFPTICNLRAPNFRNPLCSNCVGGCSNENSNDLEILYRGHSLK